MMSYLYLRNIQRSNILEVESAYITLFNYSRHLSPRLCVIELKNCKTIGYSAFMQISFANMQIWRSRVFAYECAYVYMPLVSCRKSSKLEL